MMAGRATFSSAVMLSSRLKNWKTMPMCFRRMQDSSSSVRPVTISPPTRMVPSSATSRPATRLSSVDLPHPDGPIRATKSPAGTRRLAPRSARTGAFSASKVLRTPSTTSTSPSPDRSAAPCSARVRSCLSPLLHVGYRRRPPGACLGDAPDALSGHCRTATVLRIE